MHGAPDGGQGVVAIGRFFFSFFALWVFFGGKETPNYTFCAFAPCSTSTTPKPDYHFTAHCALLPIPEQLSQVTVAVPFLQRPGLCCLALILGLDCDEYIKLMLFLAVNTNHTLKGACSRDPRYPYAHHYP